MEMEEDFSSAVFSPDQRERIVRGFEAWLDRAIADEQPPQGLTAELLAALAHGDPLPPLESEHPGSIGCDLYSLWAAMTALTQEVRLQGRTFKQLNETLSRSAQSLQESAAEGRSGGENASAEEARMQQAEFQQARKQEIRIPLSVLLDLRDRVERGGNTARNAAEELAPKRLPRLARWLGVGARYAGHTQEILSALSHGYSLTLDSLDEALVDSGVSRIACRGQIFDPQRMTAVDIEETGSVPEGTVVEVYRNGYEWNGEVYRTAQVKVARNPERKSE
ncbi:MAG TPA: nucleotide exchange factor GrpE [Terracidiphilus sp.]|jgi:molecular chaperone GrpE|nr:nucleotide exchange factor GrpE [Terracidiphilus sp.]